MNVAIFLAEVSEFNGPLMFIPGSHKLGCSTRGTTWRPRAIRCGP
jgi:ectoine hydroxylase